MHRGTGVVALHTAGRATGGGLLALEAGLDLHAGGGGQAVGPGLMALALQAQLEGTENRISTSRRDYNQAVQAYNTEIRTFPSLIAARFIYDAKPMEPFKATAQNAETAPTVSFE